jgi:hypothetical protein
VGEDWGFTQGGEGAGGPRKALGLAQARRKKDRVGRADPAILGRRKVPNKHTPPSGPAAQAK